MRPCLTALCFACFPLAALADSVHTIEVVNDTRGSIDTFAMAPREAGDGPRWTSGIPCGTHGSTMSLP